jgi:3'(2'), 5'-bisphosphate nucleotidase
MAGAPVDAAVGLGCRNDASCAEYLAEQAGALLLRLRDQVLAGAVTDADVQADLLITDALRHVRPADAILSEEISRDDPARLSADRVWIVDPLDGTREYGEAGRTDWAVHVALAERGAVTAGAVALPAVGQLWSTVGPPVTAPDRPVARIAVSRSRPPTWAAGLARELNAELVPLGSAGTKTIAVVAGDVDAYVHDGGQYEWDSAAPAAVAAHYGLHVSRADGSALTYNQGTPWLPDIVVCPPSAVVSMLAIIANLRA